MKTSIWITTQFEGIHQYPAAKDLPGVEFLANEHRHTFHVRVQVQVFHDDREIEFILFKRWIDSLFMDSVVHCNNSSCEMIARELVIQLQNRHGTHREIQVDVSEDGENGAVVEYVPEEV